MNRKIKRPRHNDPAGLRARILDQTAALFQARGFSATSMQHVMDSAAISAGALHHHFATKKSLALTVLRERVAPAVRETWIAPLLSSPALGGAIRAVFADIADGMEKRGSVQGCPLNNLALELSLADKDYRAAIQEVFTEWESALSKSIGQSRGGSRLSGRNRAAAAQFILSVYAGSMNLAKASQSAAPLRTSSELLGEWLRRQDLDR